MILSTLITPAETMLQLRYLNASPFSIWGNTKKVNTRAFHNRFVLPNDDVIVCPLVTLNVVLVLKYGILHQSPTSSTSSDQ